MASEFKLDRAKLLIRVDGSVAIGTGHVMRCYALAEGWREIGGTIHFAAAELTPALNLRLGSIGEVTRLESATRGSAEDADATKQIATEMRPDWIVADGYCFGSDWQRRVASDDLRLLLLDDYGHAEHYFADVVLNQNLHAAAGLYARREPKTRLLLGTRYALLRSEFLKWRSWQREIAPVARRLMITLGGSDPENVTTKILTALQNMAGLEIVVALGESNPHGREVDRVSRHIKSPTRVVSATKMPELMAWADLAIAAGGTTSWEMAFMGLPSVLLQLAENQSEVIMALTRAGVCVSPAFPADPAFDERLRESVTTLMNAPATRQRMSELGRTLVDGYGRARVIARMRRANLVLRPVVQDDAKLLWTWANDPVTRSVSFNSDEIDWNSHLQWFEEKLRSPQCYFYLATDGDGRPLGQIRFDARDKEAMTSVSLAPEARGQGLGPVLIMRGFEELFKGSDVEVVKAYIKSENEQSASAFAKADFTDHGIGETQFGQARQFIYTRNLDD